MTRWHHSAQRPILCALPHASSPSGELERAQGSRMTKVKRPPLSPVSLPVRIVKLHAKLAVAILVGIAVAFAVAPLVPRWGTRTLAGWDAGVVVYLVSTLCMMWRADVERIRRRARRFLYTFAFDRRHFRQPCGNRRCPWRCQTRNSGQPGGECGAGFLHHPAVMGLRAHHIFIPLCSRILRRRRRR